MKNIIVGQRTWKESNGKKKGGLFWIKAARELHQEVGSCGEVTSLWTKFGRSITSQMESGGLGVTDGGLGVESGGLGVRDGLQTGSAGFTDGDVVTIEDESDTGSQEREVGPGDVESDTGSQDGDYGMLPPPWQEITVGICTGMWASPLPLWAATKCHQRLGKHAFCQTPKNV